MKAKGDWPRERIALIPRLVLLAGMALVAVLFVISCLVMHHHGGAHRAWEVMIGDRSPFGQAAGLAVILSAVGYALVPTVVGLAAADAITRFTDKRLQSLPEAEAIIADIARRAAEELAQEQGQVQGQSSGSSPA